MKKIKISSIIKVILIFTAVESAYTRTGESDTVKISDDLLLVKISENTFIHISYLQSERYGRVPCNGLIYITSDNAYMIDTPVNDEVTLELITWVEDNMKVALKGVIVNHWHVDCMGGLAQVHKSGIKSYAHELTCEIALAKNLPVPDVSFSDSLVLNAGEKEIICRYLGGAHTVDNIVVWVPEDRILFGGCMVKSMSSRSLGNTADADLESYPSTIEKVISMFGNARIVVPGHGSYGGTELLMHTLNLAQEYQE